MQRHGDVNHIMFKGTRKKSNVDDYSFLVVQGLKKSVIENVLLRTSTTSERDCSVRTTDSDPVLLATAVSV